MGILTVIRQKMSQFEEQMYRKGQLHGERKKIKDPRRLELINRVVLTNDQKEEIDEFYFKNLGRKIPYNWHRLYQSFTGTFRKDYFPEYLYTSELEPKWNPVSYRSVFADKNLLSIFFNDIPSMRTAQIYASNVGGGISK